MARSPVKQPDLFQPRSVAELPNLRDDLDLMSHPFFALEKGRTEPMEFNGLIGAVKTHVKITGSDYGIANQWDNDILLFIRTGVVAAINRGEEVSPRIRFPVFDCLIATKRGTSGRAYEEFRNALHRLKATSIITNAGKDGWTADKGVSWIDSYEFIQRETARGSVMAACEIVVSEWAFSMMTDVKRALTIDPAYFEMSGALERKLYGIVRKFCGNQSVWFIGLEKLRDLSGSTRDLRRFRYDVKKIIERQPIVGYVIELSATPPITSGFKDISLVKSKPRGLDYLVVRPTSRLVSVR